MGKIFIDANIFLEIFLKDEKSEDCKKFLKATLENNLTICTSDFVIYTCFLQVERNLKSIKKLNIVANFFNALVNLEVIRPTISELQIAFKIMKNNRLDFDDSLVVACMQSKGVNTLISMDRDFDKLKSIRRKSP